MGDFRHTIGDQARDLFGPLTPRVKWEAPAKPPLPEDGYLLVEKVIGKILRITRPDGSFNSCMWIPGHKLDLMLKNEGIPLPKQERLLNYVWSYRLAYVSTTSDGEEYTLDEMITVAGVAP